MWLRFSRKETEGVEWASSGFHRVPDYAGPIWAGSNTFLVNAFNFNAVGRGLMLSCGLQELFECWAGSPTHEQEKRTRTWTEYRRPPSPQHTWGNWNSKSLQRLWSQGYSSISIHGLFHPQPVLFSHYLNCYQLKQQTRPTHAARNPASAHLPLLQHKGILFLSHRPAV